MKSIAKLALSSAVVIGAACATAASPASAAVTYTFVGNFQNGNYVPPNASFSITVPDFITSDQTFTAAQSDLVCGDNFVQCTGVSFSTDYPGHDVVMINFIAGVTPESVFYDFAPTAFTTVGSASEVYSYLGNATLTTAVPEPSAWALMMLGVVLLGAALRSRGGRRDDAAAAA